MLYVAVGSMAGPVSDAPLNPDQRIALAGGNLDQAIALGNRRGIMASKNVEVEKPVKKEKKQLKELLLEEV